MTSVLYRAIVGPVVPIFKDDETPRAVPQDYQATCSHYVRLGVE